MPRCKLIAAASLAALGLAGCNNPDHRAGPGSRICTPFATATNANANANTNTQMVAPQVPAAPDPSAALDDCLHRWGYTLAASTDRAQEVGQAVVAACMPALTRWNQQSVMAQGQDASAAEGAPSLLTGQPTTPVAEHYNYAQARALFYVVQGRAGKCAAPPAAAPEGGAAR